MKNNSCTLSTYSSYICRVFYYRLPHNESPHNHVLNKDAEQKISEFVVAIYSVKKLNTFTSDVLINLIINIINLPPTPAIDRAIRVEFPFEFVSIDT